MRLPSWLIGVVCLLYLTQLTSSEGTEKAKKIDGKPAIKLTGIPQKDYIHDPNLPRELNGFDLSNYPFYNGLPTEMYNFTCDGRHDGFYASIPHNCQVYHNCLFGVRYDFLCANYTSFDQSNFICHFASEVDCKHSELFYDRNEALYKEASTTTEKPKYRPHPRKPPGKRRQIKKKTTTPAPEYYYYDDNNPEYEYYYDDETTTTTTTTTTTPPPRKNLGGGKRKRLRAGQGGRRPGTRRKRPRGQRPRRRKTTTTTTTTTPPPEYEYYDDDYYYYDDTTTSSTTTTTTPAPRRSLSTSRRQRPTHSRPPSRRQQIVEQRESLPATISRGQPQGSRAAEPVPDPSEYDDPEILPEEPSQPARVEPQRFPSRRIRPRGRSS